MADKLIYIPYDDTQNYTFCRLKLVIETFEHELKERTNQNSLKLLSQRLRKRYHKTLGTSVIVTAHCPIFS